MVNPGAFCGSRKEFLIEQKEAYTDAVANDCANDRYPIDLPHEEEPTAEHLAGINDDEPDSEEEAPDTDTISPEEFEQATNAFAERAALIKKRKKQIRGWLHYQYMKEHAVNQSSPDHGFRALLGQLNGSSQRPRQQVTRNVWRKNARNEIEQETRRRAQEEGVPAKNMAPVREKVAKEMFDALDETQKSYWETRSKTKHATAVKKWEEGVKAGPSSTPLDRQQCIQALPGFIQPVLDGICAYTGWKVSLIAGGPSPAHNGRLTMLSVHSGTTKGDVKMNWGRAEHATYSDTVGASFASFLRKCYTPDECRQFAVNDDEERFFLHNLLETAEVHELPSTGTPRPSSPTASSPQTNPRAEEVVNTSSSTENPRDLTERPDSVSHPGPRPKPRPVPRPVPRQPPVDSATTTSTSSRLPALSSDNPQLSSHQVPSMPPRLSPPPPPPPPPPLPSMPIHLSPPPPPPRPSRPLSPRSSAPPSPRPSLPPSPRSSPAPLHQQSSTTAEVSTIPQKRPPEPIADTITKKLRVSDEVNMQSKRVRKPTAKAQAQRQAPQKSLIKPKWFTQSIKMMETKKLGQKWDDLLTAWAAFEEKESYQGGLLFPTTNRPEVIEKWIAARRPASWQPDKLVAKTYVQQFKSWWSSIQPSWRLGNDGQVIPCLVDGDLSSLRRPGINGWNWIMAGLFFWGINAKSGRPRAAFLETLDDFLAILHALSSPSQ